MIEITHKDLLARIAKFRTKSGIVETPAFIPVVHPIRELIPPRRMYSDFDYKLIITNAYLLSKAEIKGTIHDILDFPGSIMTDSGAYQLLIYGDVEISPSQIIEFQERIESDMAVILDIPTGGHATYNEAKYTVEATLRRARESMAHRTKDDILWVGPIQGGTYPDLVTYSAQEISKLDFQIVAIGSPTQLMEQYKFDKLVDLIMAAKKHVPLNKPVHLFGAGHPLIFPLIVAMGCDLFDSAAYALFAKHNRFLSSEGTYRLEELHDGFCNCPTCSEFSISEIKKLEKNERIRVIAEHNLRICQLEIRRIKQAIKEGRLWRLVESRLSSHPAIVDAFSRLKTVQTFFEQFSPISKKRAVYITSQWSSLQPEIVRHKARMETYIPPEPKRDKLLVFSVPQKSPYHSATEYERFCHQFGNSFPELFRRFDTIFLSPFLGLIPLELTSFYPLSQHVTPQTFFTEKPIFLIEQVQSYLIRNKQYDQLIGIFAQSDYWQMFTQRCRAMLKKSKEKFKLFQTDFSSKSLKKIIAQMVKDW